MANPNATKWIPPLPPGWEGRWDANQRAYFFIDHSTKKTTWQDPRFNQKVVAQPPFPPKKNMYDNPLIPGLSPEPTFVVDDAMVNRIHMDYPRVPLDTIKDIVSACNFNENESRVTLTRMGYQKGEEPSHTTLNTSDSRPKSGKARAKSPSKSPARSPARSPPRSPARSPSPAPAPSPPMSEEEKKKVLNKMKSEFPSLDNMVITMALDVCEYKESQARTVLKGWGDTKMAANKAYPKSDSNTTEPAASTSLEPVGFDDSEQNSPSRPFSAQKSSQPKKTTKKTTVVPKKTKTVVPKKTTPAATSHPGQKRTKPTQVTQQTQPRHQVVTHQPRTNSEYRTQTLGPNPDLRMGPDKSLLLSEYTLVHGPNPSNRQGTDPSRVNGAQGAFGPDPANRCGPNSAPINNHQQYLVTSI
ncbi:putative uncharacterized protein DDB_G0290521 isoform X2 [Ylistrum balloti]|uniref:putative uncharacterized protein DDB_G0290521 isoform X2 n=1 Tax=Ylistrum balloti TaxID=509963 RepID=UPI002905F74C|nr:putative uncharacterized protein DDB_G0290521 isoform X2 [Ylistrum balloti]